MNSYVNKDDFGSTVVMRKPNRWIPIEHVGECVKGREMFVVKAFNVVPGKGLALYTSDPWCVWLDDRALCGFARWPHLFKPTHFILLPEDV